MQHIVEFENCKTCVFYKTAEDQDPCHDCLNCPVNEDSRRPIHYKEDSSKAEE